MTNAVRCVTIICELFANYGERRPDSGLRRRKEGALPSEIHGLTIRENEAGEVQSVERVTVQKRHWEPKMNFYPIPDAERFKNPDLPQNEGW